MYKSKICKLYDQIDSINEIVRLEIETNVIGSIIKSCKKISFYIFFMQNVFFQCTLSHVCLYFHLFMNFWVIEGYSEYEI